MNNTMRLSLFVFLALVSLSLSVPAQAQQTTMTFFVTSVGPGKGADLGGLEGADRHCQALAQAAGCGRPHLARLPQHAGRDGAQAVNARDRIGRGPWQNAKGVGHRQGCRRAARQQQSHQADRAQREGRGGQRPRRHAQPARHPHRLAAGRPRVSGRRGPDLRQLDQERAKGRPWSATTTAWGCDERRRRPSRGTRRIRRAGRTAAAARPTCAAPAATGCSTALRRTRAGLHARRMGRCRRP